MKKDITTPDIEELLAYRFDAPAYAFLPQVRNGTGYSRSQTRTADALAMGLWPSRGLHLNGFEIKIYRQDWTKELKNPEKAEEIAQYCDFWWIVAPKEIVKEGEIPANWGLMVPHGGGLKVVKDAIQLKAKRLDRPLLAAILRRAQEYTMPDGKIRAARNKGINQGKEQAEKDFQYQIQQHEELKKTVANFEKQSGIAINAYWSRDNIGDAVKRVLDGEDKNVKQRLLALLPAAQGIVSSIKNHLKDTK